MIMGMKGVWAVPIIASILILGALGFTQDVFALPPDPISDLTLTVLSSTEVQLNWSAPADNGSTILKYNIFRNLNDSGLVPLVQIDGSLTSYVDTTLSAGDSVKYRMSVVNGDGLSVFSNIPDTVTTLATPDAVTDLATTVISSTQVDISWTIPFDGGSPITNYLIFRNLNANGFLPYANVILSSLTEFSDITLTLGDKVTYGVKAVNDIGPAPPSNVPPPVVLGSPPDAINDLTLTKLSSTEVRLDWSPPTSSTPLTSYQIFRNLNGQGMEFLIEVTDGTIDLFIDDTLNSDDVVTYGVKSLDIVGLSAPSNVPSPVIMADIPEAINDLSLSIISDFSVTLEWSTPFSNQPITSYKIFRDLNSAGLLPFTEIFDGSIISFTDSTLSEGDSVTYSVRAVNVIATGPDSNIPPEIVVGPAKVIDGFESYSIGTQNPGPWTFARAAHEQKAADVEIGRVQNAVVNGGVQAYEIIEETTRSENFPRGAWSVANLFQLGIDASHNIISVDVFGQNLVGQGGEPNRGGVVGVIVRFNLDDGTDKSIGWRTASNGNKPVTMFYTDDGVNVLQPTATFNNFATNPSAGIWHTLTKNVREEFNAVFTLEDYDTNVVDYNIFLIAASYTSQVPTTHGSQGFYDNISLTSASCLLGGVPPCQATSVLPVLEYQQFQYSTTNRSGIK